MRNTMIQFKRRFTKELENEAVRLSLTRKRTQREIASDSGIGQSTLTRWISRSRSRPTDSGDEQAEASMITELNQLRYKNEILRQERDILKQTVAFYMSVKASEVR